MFCVAIFTFETPLRNLLPGSRKSHSSKENDLLEVKSIKCDSQTSEPKSLVS